MKKRGQLRSFLFIFIISCVFCNESFSQGVGLNATGVAPDASSMLDVSSPGKGLLIPRMDSTSRKNINTPAQSLLVYDTTTNCLEIYRGTVWQPLSCACINPPAAAGIISGPSSVCQGQSVVLYAVPAIANATSYTWSYSGTGVSIYSSTNITTLNFSTSATSGNLTVRGTNACGNGIVSANFPVTVNPLPTAGTISGTSTIYGPQNNVSYSVTIANATGYIWSYSGGGATISGSTNPMTMNFIDGATSGILTVTGTNACGSGAVSADFPITVPEVCGISVGSTYGGGIVFYLDASGCHGLVCAPSDQSVFTGIAWYSGGYATTGALGDSIGKGMENTNKIVTTYGVGAYAAYVCDTLSLGGYTDWYLPSKYELNLMYVNLGAHGLGSFVSNWYWSSTEYNAGNCCANYQSFGSYNGSQGLDSKQSTKVVRAVRIF